MADQKIPREKFAEKVRVKLPNKAEATVSAALAELAGDDAKPLTNKPATRNGAAIPVKYHQPTSRPATTPADTPKEN